MRYDPETGETNVYRAGTNQGNGLLWSPRGSLYCCEMIGRRVSSYGSDGSICVIADRFDGKKLNSPNDLVMDAIGRIWFTDPRYGEDRDDMELDHESVYRLTHAPGGDWEIERVTFDTTRPNGLLLSLDEKTLYVAQSDYGEGRKRELRAYPVLDDGSLGDFRVMHNFAPARGIDGMTIDSDDRIVATAGWTRNGAGPMIYVFEPSGRVLESHRVPVDMPTNCCFGGENLSDVYVTAGSGHLFRVKTDLKGVRR
jgi:gluconolactonase